MEILNISKSQPAEPEITHIDVRITRDEAMLIGGLVARTNGPVGDTVAKGGGAAATRIFRTLHQALGLHYDGFNDGGQYIAIVPNAKYVAGDGTAKLPGPPSDPYPVKVDGVNYDIASAALVIKNLRADRERDTKRIAHLEDRVKETGEALSIANDTLRENRERLGQQASTIMLKDNEIDRLKRQQQTLLDKIDGALRNIDAAKADLA